MQSPELCLQDGIDLRGGIGVTQDHDAARAKFELACEGGSADGCTYLAIALQETDDPVNHARAFDLFAQSCDAAEMMACAQLGSHYLMQAWAKHEASGQPETAAFVSANELLRRACVADEPEGAADVWGVSIRAIACGNLAVSFEHGFGVPQDLRTSLDLNAESCERGWPRSCAQVGYFYEHGLGVEQSRAHAVEMFRRACAQNDAMGCHYLGTLGGDRAALQRACEAAYPGACEALEVAP